MCQLDFQTAARVIMHGSVFLSVPLASTDDGYQKTSYQVNHRPKNDSFKSIMQRLADFRLERASRETWKSLYLREERTLCKLVTQKVIVYPQHVANLVFNGRAKPACTEYFPMRNNDRHFIVLEWANLSVKLPVPPAPC